MTTTESPAQRCANRILAVDEYRTLDEHTINYRRVVFVSEGEKRSGGYGLVRKAHLHASAYLPTWLSRSGPPQVVAVKEIILTRMGNPSDVKRAFTKEVLVRSRLKGHPGVSKLLGFYADFDRREAWLISPWEPYGNVSDFIKGRKLEVPERLSLAFDTLDALAFLHQLNPPICHGDIKSPNVLVNSEFRAVLCDFGLARLYEDSGFARLEITAEFKGSIPWSSPELLNGAPRTASSDIYAWAWLVWEIMTGELPYGEEVKGDHVIMIFPGPVGQADGESRLRECLQLWELLTRCWSAEPAPRPTSAMCKTTFEYLPRYPPTPESTEPHARSAAQLQKLGELESWKGNHKAGLAYLEEALHLYEEEGNDKGIASILLKQAAVAFRDLNITKMTNAASAALEKCRSLQDDIGVADALYWLGTGDVTLENAIRNLQESLKIFQAKENSMGIARCLSELGGAYVKLDEYAEALPFLEEAVDVASRCGDRLGEARALTFLGATHSLLNHQDQAISILQRACNIARSIGWEPGLSTSLCRLAYAKLRQGSHAEVEEQFRESVRVARSSERGWRLAQGLKGLSICLQTQGRHEDAVSALEESCSVYQNLALAFDVSFAHAAALLADSKSTLGHKEEALAWYDTAIAEFRKGGYEDKASECSTAKAAILADMKRRDEGALHGEASS